jgi:hypothetical protein
VSSPEDIEEVSEISTNTLSIPAGFDFSTHQKVTTNIIENTGYAKYDVYANDPKITFEYFTPSKDVRGTLAFEDLCPSTGDYDFNDIALNYSVTVFLNADNLAVGFDFKYKVILNRAGSYNGIGFEIEGIAPSQIESVTKPILTFDIIKLNSNGTEVGKRKLLLF